MRIQKRALLASVIAAGGLWFVADATLAGDVCKSCAPPPPPPTPPVPPKGGCYGGGCTPPSPPVVCCGGGNLNVNVNINNVHAGASANASANASARAYAGSRAASTVIVAGGGGAYFNVDQPYPLTAQGLAVESVAAEVVRTPYTLSRRTEKRVRIQAVCIDDRNVPHPASQVRPGKDVNYEGEIYRCIVGSKMQYTITDLDGGPGETLNCNKREALWYGANQLECRPEKRERDCNERSLLRRYGAGVKELLLVREETYTEYREEVVQRSVVTGGAMMMDGGVGGRVF